MSIPRAGFCPVEEKKTEEPEIADEICMFGGSRPGSSAASSMSSYNGRSSGGVHSRARSPE
jgi:hypothetical protein